MKRMIYVLLVAVFATLTLGVARKVRAQDPPQQQYPPQRQYSPPQAPGQGWDWNADATERQFRDFDKFMRDHPFISKKLREKPERVNDRGFLNGNKELRQWLDDHPAAATAFHEEPMGFMDRERHFEIYGADYDTDDAGRGALARFDWFLDGHPDIRHDLMRKPDLVDKHDYLDHHPDLRELLASHPEVGAQLQNHPREFMDREARYGRD